MNHSIKKKSQIPKVVHVNRNHKDSVFCKAFDTKEHLLSLYNALNNSNYTNPKDLLIRRLGNHVFIGMRNDVSFIINGTLNLYEHQSSINKNMPLRGLLYVADHLKMYIKEHKLDVYGTKLVKIPKPQYIVFYNGKRKSPERTELHLKDAFLSNGNDEDYLDFKATMININYGRNSELLNRCQRLKEYSLFVNTMNRYMKNQTNTLKAAQKAVDWCIENDILKDVLLQGGIAEMYAICYDENLHKESEAAYNQSIGEQRGLKKGRRQGHRQGRRLGRQEGKQEGLKSSLLTLLSTKGNVPPNLKKYIQKQSRSEILNTWLLFTTQCSSITEFCETIGFVE